MKAEKIGIWMDHQRALLTEFTTEPMVTTCIRSGHNPDEKVNHGEWTQHNKAQHQQAEFYNTLAVRIRQYKSVLLFGPTSAKTELFNLLRKDHLFDHIAVGVEETDKMTEVLQHAHVRNYFARH